MMHRRPANFPTRSRCAAASIAAALAILVVALHLRADEPYARSRDYDLQHSRIALRFDLENKKVIGDVTQAAYTQIDERRVRVTGSVWDPQPYTMKLEGAGGGAFQTIMIVGVTDPRVLANLDAFHDKMRKVLTRRIERTMGAAAGVFDVSLRLYGWNAVTGRAVPPGTPPPREVGVMCSRVRSSVWKRSPQ